MIHIQKLFPIENHSHGPDEIPGLCGADRENRVPGSGMLRPLFLDIETTGLSSARNHVYLIGCCFPLTEQNCEGLQDPAPFPGTTSSDSGHSLWEFHQWFACDPHEEKDILTAFAAFTRDFDLPVHFNGDTFDLPFLRDRAGKYGVEIAFLSLPGVDLLKFCRPLKRLLRLPNVKLKTLECFLGIFREDEYSGGQLVEVYKNYVKHPEPEAERLLLLHNREDILNMPRVLPLLAYHKLWEGAFQVTEVLSCTEDSGTLTLELRLDLTLPRPVFFEESDWKGRFKENILHLTCPLYSVELKYFFENYRDYYYLPLEDTCMHKSVAEFVDKDHRCRCTKETAFIRHEGIFLPLPGEDIPGVRIFRPGYKDLPYTEWSGEPDPRFWTEYCRSLCRRLK